MVDYRSSEAREYRKLYKTARWERLRQQQLGKAPFCQWCEAKGRTTPATVCHHTEPHRGDHAKFYDPNNLTSLCAPCHDNDAGDIERRGYSTEIGVDGYPVDPKHPSNL